MVNFLFIVPYGIFPPIGGGQFRPLFFLRELARENRVTALICGQSREAIEQGDAVYQFPEGIDLRIPSVPRERTALGRGIPRRAFDWCRYRWLRRSLRGPTSSLLLNYYDEVREAVEQTNPEVVIFNHTYTMRDFAPVVTRLRARAVRILSTHNVNSDLKKQIIDSKPTPATIAELRSYEIEKWTESNLDRFADAFVANSDVDVRRLTELSGGRIPGFAVPTGVDTVTLTYDGRLDKRQDRRLLFCGSLSYPPNVNGLCWFHEHVWPAIREALPDVRLTVIGKGGDNGALDGLRADGSVEILGQVPSTLPYYHRTSMAIVPLLQGSGTRVKIMEAMSLGSPVVSTRLGAEGIPVGDDEEIMLADEPQAFAAAVVRLLTDAEVFERIRQVARRRAEADFDWKVVGRKLNDAAREIVAFRGHPGI